LVTGCKLILFTLPHHTIGDTWYIVDGSLIHCFFCISPEENPDWNWDIGHAVSHDLVTWDFVGIAVKRGKDEDWDSQTLSTGSVIYRDGRYWMAYSGIQKGENPPSRKIHRVGIAVSNNLYTWEKLTNNPVNERDPRHYERLGPIDEAYSQWRDPFLYEHGGNVYQLVCARNKHTDHSKRGAIGIAISTDMKNWQVLPPIDVEPIATELEVPQVYEIQNEHFLVFCTSPGRLQPSFINNFPNHQFRKADYSMVSESPLGPFKIHGTGEIISSDNAQQPYASRLVEWQKELFLIGTVRQGSITGVSDPIPVVADKFGIHQLSG
jgi:beta-fructofuranosidase